MSENSLLDEAVLETVDGCINGPAMRSIYLRKASEEYNAGNIEKSVYYQMQSLCIMGKHKYFLEKARAELVQHYDPSEFEDSPDFETNELIEYAKEYLKSDNSQKFEVNLESLNDDIKETYEDLLEFCEELPKEWTVLHISKEYNPNTTFSTKTEILCQNEAIFLTVLKYSCNEKNSNMIPICIRIPCNNDIYSKHVKTLDNFRDKLHFSGADTKKNRLTHLGNLKMVEKDIENLVESFKEFIGPWICLFSGDISGNNSSRDDDKRRESLLKLYEIVDDFIKNNKLNTETRNIINLIVKRLDLLTDNNLEILCEYLSDNEKSKNHNQIDLYEKFIELFLLLKKKYDSNKNNYKKCEYLPCILIIDEVIDHFFWEMLNPKQEFYRISSMHMLKKLYNKYKYRIRNGYIQMIIENGSCIINPDKSLNKMEERMKIFFDYWLPNWQKLIGQIPTSDEYKDFLQTSNCFVYCGHGSGLQYLNSNHIVQLDINSVIFLFGCDSVCLKSNGIHCEMSASHLYYHAALCPSVIGSLLPVLDLQMDTVSTLILSMWIPGMKSNKKLHWLNVDRKVWYKDSKIVETKSNETNSFPEFEPKLGKILTYIRCDDNLTSFYNKIGIIIRGLPVLSQNLPITKLKFHH